MKVLCSYVSLGWRYLFLSGMKILSVFSRVLGSSSSVLGVSKIVLNSFLEVSV